MRRIKFISINIYKGKYLGELVNFLNKENPDICAMQEVTRFEMNSWHDKSASLFELLKKDLGMYGVYRGDNKLKGSLKSTLGNAVFSRFPITKSRVITLKKFRPVTYDETDGSLAFKIRPLLPRHFLDATCDLGDFSIHAISWHGAWTAPPSDTKETLKQAKIVADYIKSLNEPFILAGDLNNVPESKTVGMINKVSKNLMIGSGVSQTTHPNIHKIVPRGYLVDYIFTSDQIKTISLEVPAVTVSDHLPVVAVLEI